jgi:hypothetical protein
MKKLFFIALALTLAACSGYQPVPPTPQPTAIPPTPVIQVQTVVVEITSTSPPPTPIPTLTPVPTQAPTQTPTQPAPTETPTQAVPAGPTLSVSTQSTGTISIPSSFNGPVLTNITVSTNWFSLRCNPKTIVFDLFTTDVYITQVELYYRIRDKHSTYVPDWSRAASLETDGGNHFWLTFSGEQVTPDNRKASGWFDFQFVGINKLGDVVGRSEHITNIVSYAIDCQ